jgi:N-acetylmuramoyl-L-alanine amidase
MRSSKSPTLGRGLQILTATAFVWAGLLAGQESAPPTPAAVQNPTPAIQRLVLIDPAHGGSETGAMLNPAIPEKDVNLAFARRLRQELTSHGLAAQLLRDEDNALTADQRAALSNSRRPTLYLSIHSTSLGSGVSVISALLSPGATIRGLFLPWQTAQSAWLAQSRLIGTLVTPTVQRWGLPARSLWAPLQPLNNITGPALAIEIAPNNGDVMQLASVEYQQRLSTAVANALAGTISLLPVRPGATP